MTAQSKPWREIAVPHEDVLKGTFQQAEFAADLTRVHEGKASEEYQDPKLFFQRTFITEGMRLLLDSVVKRLAGKGGDPVIQLQTAFGGGKTHTLLAVYHLAQGKVPATDMEGIPPILDTASVAELPTARIVVLDGIKLSPSKPSKYGKVEVNTLWGELAWQLGGAEAYERIKESDTTGTSPGKGTIADLLRDYAPCVILMDELVAYVRQLDEGKSYRGGTYDSNLTFIQALTEGLKAVPNALLLASLPESEREAGSAHGVQALHTLEHYFGRVQALWKPVATEEAFEIVRRRLFTSIRDRGAMEAVCRGFADFYVGNADHLPNETQESRYYDRLCQAYPIHPEVFDRLYEDWSSLDNFQRTRGVLKLMAKAIHRLWKDGNNDLLILPGSLPLYDADVRNECVQYLPQGWDPVVERDIDGDRAETTDIETHDTRLGSVQACRRVARTIFLGSAPSSKDQHVRGVEVERIVLGCVQPGQSASLYRDAVRRLTDRLHYLNSAAERFWFDTRPNLRREMEDRKRRFKDKEDVFPVLEKGVRGSIPRGVFSAIHVFSPSGDVPDEWALRLVVLPPDAPYSRSEERSALEKAAEILKSRGEQPRTKQNRLLFLAADAETIARLKDQVRSLKAWESILSDYTENRIVLDNLMAETVRDNVKTATKSAARTLREVFRWLLAPSQEVTAKGVADVRWEAFALNPSEGTLGSELERVARENELVISQWAPIHLREMLKRWFWKDDAPAVSALDVWQKTCCYLYLPRLQDEGVYKRAMETGTGSRDFFGVAYGTNAGKYEGFSFAKHQSPILDDTLLLIEPGNAAAYEEATRPAPAPVDDSGSTSTGGAGGTAKPVPGGVGSGTTTVGGTATAVQARHTFYGSVELDTVQAKMQFAKIVDEVLLHFASQSNARVTVRVDIEAHSTTGFNEQTVRTVKENANTLKFNNAEFE